MPSLRVKYAVNFFFFKFFSFSKMFIERFTERNIFTEHLLFTEAY